jgi:anaerobic magnesium-protoporphyrin IX monomethyl ester cyclase
MAHPLKVTLVRGPMVTATPLSNLATPSLALAYLGGYAQANGYEVQVVDALAEALDCFWPVPGFPEMLGQGLTFDEAIDRIPPGSEVIGFTVMFSAEWPVQRDFITAARKRFPHALFVAGGEHVTALTEYSLSDCPALDVCVRGEGEQTFFELLEARREGRSIGETVSNIGWRTQEGEIRINGTLPRIKNLASIPLPHWPEGYLERFWRAGKAFGIQSERDMPMLASRGCPYECTFCSNPRMWTTRYILRNPDDVIAEIKHWIAEYDITAVQFYDLTAIVKKSWTMEFCQKLLDNGIKLNWSLPSGTRSEALDEDTLGMLKKTGCNFIVYAPESGEPETLKIIKKKVKLERLSESILTAKRLGLVTRANLLIGFPHETRRQILGTIRYGLYLAWHGVDDVGISLFSPYPGTEIFDDLLARGVVSLEDSYFMTLNSRWIKNQIAVNPRVGARELAFYRLGFMLVNYSLGYLRYPSRIVRTLRNVFFRNQAATNFEHFLKNAFRKFRPLPRSA